MRRAPEADAPDVRRRNVVHLQRNVVRQPIASPFSRCLSICMAAGVCASSPCCLISRLAARYVSGNSVLAYGFLGVADRRDAIGRIVRRVVHSFAHRICDNCPASFCLGGALGDRCDGFLTEIRGRLEHADYALRPRRISLELHTGAVAPMSTGAAVTGSANGPPSDDFAHPPHLALRRNCKTLHRSDEGPFLGHPWPLGLEQLPYARKNQIAMFRA